MSPPIRPSPTASPARVRRLLAGRWPRLFSLVAWAVLLAACTAAYGALAGPVLRALFGGAGLTWPAWAVAYLPPPPDLDALRRWLPWILAGVAVLKALAHHRHAVGLAVLGQSIVADLRGRLHARITAMPPDHVALMGAGDLISRATHDVDATEQLVVHGMAAVVRDGLQAAALLAVCVALDPWLALVAFGVYPIAFWPVARFARRLRRAAGDAHHERGALTVELTDQLRRLALIQASGARGWAGRRFSAVVEAVRAAVVRSVRIKAFASPFTEVLGALALAGTLIYATDRIASGDLAAENVIGFFAALMMLYQPIKGLVRAQEVIQPGRAALDRLDALFATTAALPAGGDRPPPDPIGRLTFEAVEVRRGDRLALTGVDLELRTGESVALVGPNGAGKTTIAWVLARLLDPSTGRVQVDGLDLSTIDPAGWRGRVGWVTQELDLGRGTLRDNVLFGDPPGAAGRLDAVAARTGVDALVERLPEGWQTAIGDGGVGLSGGERQRVALARALVRDPAVLVLDEPDAHLDAEAVRTLGALLPDLARDRIVLLITHEPAVADLADRQVRLQAGRVVP